MYNSRVFISKPFDHIIFHSNKIAFEKNGNFYNRKSVI